MQQINLIAWAMLIYSIFAWGCSESPQQQSANISQAKAQETPSPKIVPPPATEAAAVAAVDQPAPGFELPDLEGNPHKLSDFRGKVVVLHFQSINCPWDVGYQPILNTTAAEFTGDEVVFVAINSNSTESVEQIKRYATTQVDYLVLKDPQNQVADKYDAATTPHLYLIDAEGVLRYRGGVEKDPPSPGKVGTSTRQYLVPVLKAMVGKCTLPATNTKPTGCGIKRISG